MKTTIFCTIIITTLNSCATIFNSRTQNIDIHANKPVKIILNNDTIPYLVNHHGVKVNRSKAHLNVKLFNDSTEKNVIIPSQLDPAYWFNFYSPYLTGFLIDLTNLKRFAYPKTLYVNMDSTGNNYLTYLPWDNLFPKRKSIFKITPLKTIGFVNPGLELSYEWRNNQKFSSQIAASYIFPISVWDLSYDFYPDMKGFSVSFEEKYYLKRPAPHGLYLGFELSYLNNNYNTIHSFVDKDEPDTTYYEDGYLDSIYIEKQTFSMNLKVGYQFFIKRLSFDFYVGLGARYKDVRHFDRIKPDDVFESPRHPNVFYYSDLEGKYWTISIPLNFKIGWVF